MKHQRVLLVVCTALACLGCSAQQAPCADTPTRSQGDGFDDGKLKAILEETQNVLQVPGLQMAVRTKDGRVWTGAVGCSVAVTKQALQTNQPMPIGSITKTLTAAAMLKLVEEKKVDLAAPVATYLPQFPRAAEFTVRQVLSHTAGVLDYLDSTFVKAMFDAPERLWTDAELLDISATRRSEKVPNKSFSYSNAGYVLAGEIIRKVTGEPWSNTAEKLIGPAGIDIKPWTAELHVVESYQDSCSGPNCKLVLESPSPFRQGSFASAAGDRLATATALVNWSDALYGAKVLSAASLGEMKAFVSTEGWFGEVTPEYGLGTMSFVNDKKQRFIGHSGSVPSFQSLMLYEPESQTSISVLSSSSPALLYNQLMNDVAVRVLEAVR
jgi:D-alanyl-D-alanine carboxypeptidase